MSFRRAVETTGVSIFLFATAALIATGCSSGSGSSGTGGAPGTGGHGSGGHVGTGGTTGSGGAAGAGMGGAAQLPTCTPLPADPTMPVLYDFNDMSSINFGTPTTVQGTLALFTGVPDVSTGAWVIDQDVTGYGDAGASIDILSCGKVDLSAFTGFAFDIAGVITPQMAGVDAGTIPPQQLTLQVGTAQDDVASNYDAQNGNAPTWGTCVPTGGNQYDGSCASPSVVVPFAPGPTLVTKSFLWSQIGGGKGQPGGRATPDPTQITRFSWIFPYNFGNNPVPFHINITIDNIRLLTAGGTTTDAGSGTGTDTATITPPADAATD